MFKRLPLHLVSLVCVLFLLPWVSYARLANESCADDLLSKSQNYFTEEQMRSTFRDVHVFWAKEFQNLGWEFNAPEIVIYQGKFEGPCGTVHTATGPMFCPVNNTLYLDLEFFTLFRDEVGTPSLGLLNYVISHEIGHHIQNLRGSLQKVVDMYARDNSLGNELMRKVEFQADCLAGVYLMNKFVSGELDQSAIVDAIQAVTRVGDDSQALIAAKKGRVGEVPQIHGSGKQRRTWMRIGMATQMAQACEPFGSPILTSEPNP